MYNIPISLHVFNRPELTKKVLLRIREVKPKYLFITQDAPRPGNKSDHEKSKQVTRVIESLVDWDVKLDWYKYNRNQGSFQIISHGLDRVFSKVNKAIILEDDCIPSDDFFIFMKWALNTFENDDNIACVSGSNFNPSLIKQLGISNIFISKYPHTWGWGTWRKKWKKNNFYNEWPKYRFSVDMFKHLFHGGGSEYLFWNTLFERIYLGLELPHWDYLFVFNSFMRKKFCIVPPVNLVSNVGYDLDATNTKRRTIQHNIPTARLDFSCLSEDYTYIYAYDKFISKHIFGRNYIGFIKQLIKFLLNILHIYK